MVDIGTGYFVDLPVPDAKDYFKRREKFLTEQLSSLTKSINEKRKSVEGRQ